MINIVTDSDLQIGGGGGGHPDPEIRGAGPDLKEKFFSALWASLWSKIRRRPGPPGPSPGSTTEIGPRNRPFYLPIRRPY